ncbi:MAG: cyclase family protein [Gammaproteobacteria bacterium]|nr:cyclase family protein [Gammaproteobacteria bacterium]
MNVGYGASGGTGDAQYTEGRNPALQCRPSNPPRRCVVKTLCAGLAALLALTLDVQADDLPVSPFGADDTLGAVNRLSPAGVLAAVKLVKTGKTYPLGVVTGPDSPAYPPRYYKMTILQLDDGAGVPVGDNHLTGNDDFMITYMGVGSQIDGLGHVGVDHHYFNNTPASDFVKVTGLTKFSTSDLPPIVTRGVLLDIAKLAGKAILDEGTAINRAEIEAACQAQGVTIGEGDVVLLHTGWMNMAERDAARFMKGEPGLGVDGAKYLASLGIVAVGADSFAVETIPFETQGQFFPVHQEMLAKNGIYLLENMDTRELARDGVSEFLFVLGQPRFAGSVQAIINPVAIR